MKKRLLLILTSAVIATFAFTGTSHAFGAGVGAGVYMPGGDISFMDPGFGINAHVDFDVFPMFDFRIGANYYQSDGKKHGDKYELQSTGGQALIIFRPPVPVVKPYIGAGYGVYSNNMKIKFDEGGSKTDDDWGHGFVAQAGIGVSVLIVNLGLHGQYFINNNGDDYGGYSVGLSAGLSF